MEYIIRNNHKRKAGRVVCFNCDKSFLKLSWQLKKSSRHFCCNACVCESNIKERVDLECSYCSKKFQRRERKLSKSKSALYFCSRGCKDLAQRIDSGFPEIHPNHYGKSNGIYSYRIQAFRKYEHKCERCNYEEFEEALVVHHIDYNRKNNKIDNLMILCKNCHTLVHSKIIVIEGRDFKLYKDMV